MAAERSRTMRRLGPQNAADGSPSPSVVIPFYFCFEKEKRKRKNNTGEGREKTSAPDDPVAAGRRGAVPSAQSPARLGSWVLPPSANVSVIVLQIVFMPFHKAAHL